MTLRHIVLGPLNPTTVNWNNLIYFLCFVINNLTYSAPPFWDVISQCIIDPYSEYAEEW